MYVPPPFPNHPQNKRETQNKKQNCKDIEDHSRPRCNAFEPFVSFDQSYHLRRFIRSDGRRVGTLTLQQVTAFPSTQSISVPIKQKDRPKAVSYLRIDFFQAAERAIVLLHERR